MRRSVRWLSVVVLLGAGGIASAGPRAVVPERTLELPVREVTVFSDRARVTRQADVRLEKGTQTVVLPRLPPTVDPDSVRVEASGAKIARVEVKRATLDEFPRTEAEALLRQLEKLRDEATAIREQMGTLERELRLVQGIRPAVKPIESEKSAPMTLEPAGWLTSLKFIDAREAAAMNAIVPLERQLRRKLEELAVVSEKARLIAATNSHEQQLTVTAVVEGEGRTAELRLVYMAQQAVWRPSYDVRYTPGETTVEVGFAALVSQQTGEDWNDARLTLSTAVPTTTATLPQLAVWKIGDRERFLPTPQAAVQSAKPNRSQAVPPPREQRSQENDALRHSLIVAANEERPFIESISLGSTSAARKHMNHGNTLMGSSRASVAQRQENRASELYDFAEADDVDESPAPSAMAESARPVSKTLAGATRGSGSSYVPTESVSFGAPRGWQPPGFSGDLPASLAGGYTFVYPSARAESIRSGGETRRVALSSKRFPATPFLKLMPALSKQAFLVADVKNDGDRPLLGGRANLFVGADLVGDAMLPTTAIGQTVTLPLGVDDSIRIERNVNVVSSERGVFSKQDVNSYSVTIELLNPRSRPVKAKVIDQVPLVQGKDLDIALDKSEPQAVRDETDGTLEWALDLPAGQKKTLSFTYSVARPKDSKLWQQSRPAVNH